MSQRTILGETAIGSCMKRIRSVSLRPQSVQPTPGVVEAIRDADLDSVRHARFGLRRTRRDRRLQPRTDVRLRVVGSHQVSVLGVVTGVL